ncbi:MAG TPA: hypothetical protein VJC03_08430 [bacterium]|nr:hypothetical protein [bacterium]
MKKTIAFFSALLMGIILVGCAGTKAPMVGQQKVVERSAKETPEWVMVPFFEDKEMMYFAGTVKGVADYAVGLRQAKAEAVKNIAESIQSKVRTEFTETTRGANIDPGDLGKFVQDAIAMVTENVNIQGMLPAENYYEKVEEATEYGVKYFYNCHTLYQLPVKDYRLARSRALDGMAQKYKEENNKKAEEAAMSLLEKMQ